MYRIDRDVWTRQGLRLSSYINAKVAGDGRTDEGEEETRGDDEFYVSLCFEANYQQKEEEEEEAAYRVATPRLGVKTDAALFTIQLNRSDL